MARNLYLMLVISEETWQLLVGVWAAGKAAHAQN